MTSMYMERLLEYLPTLSLVCVCWCVFVWVRIKSPKTVSADTTGNSERFQDQPSGRNAKLSGTNLAYPLNVFFSLSPWRA